MDFSAYLFRRNLLAKHSAAVTPIKPKKGADVGQVSYEMVAIMLVVVIWTKEMSKTCWSNEAGSG